MSQLSPLGVCVLPPPRPNASRTVSYPDYIHEILGHAGVAYTSLAFDDLASALPQLTVLLTVGEASLPADLASALQAWVGSGGQWISVGGVCGQVDLLGVTPEPSAYLSFGGGGSSTLGEGYLQPTATSRLTEHVNMPLHFFNGIPVRVDDATVLATALDAHQRATTRPALTVKAVGQGRSTLIAVDIPGTVVRIQQGIGVTRDGVSAPDGTAPVGDNVLKSGDGSVLDWIFDRQPVPSVPGLNAFLQPIADLWREVLLRTIFEAADAAGTALPVLWFYPRNLPALAHLSHDTDGNEIPLGERLLEVVNEQGIHSTWCVIVPGYPPELMDRIKASGHEFAMHYDSMSDDCPWSHELFHAQWVQLVEMFGGEPVSNKNHYLRWEGDVEFFHWCVEHGIQLDQTKGASKTGEAGYNFGTCHVYFPVDFGGEVIDVLEMTTPTQDLEIFAPTALLYPLAEAVLKSNGILHLLFHPAHIAKPDVAAAIAEAVKITHAAGMEWWTAAQINAWERARRCATWTWSAEDIVLHNQAELPSATLMRLGEHSTISVNGDALPAVLVNRWGFNFSAAIL